MIVYAVTLTQPEKAYLERLLRREIPPEADELHHTDVLEILENALSAEELRAALGVLQHA